MTIACLDSGSSPLARGLPDFEGQVHVDVGIIPARAGFTSSPPRRPSGLSDHPRSRGVYSFARSLESRSSGSSPLARGLRSERRLGLDLSGIIPARAGFTCDDREPLRKDKDHPRSRGVYAPRTPPRATGSGSSPLARGLLPFVVDRELRVWIIPARAGFTLRPCACTGTKWDHPRSRGVYEDSDAPRRGRQGSSPLARGLQDIKVTPKTDAGIIPARAGFTPPRWRRRSTGRDHPRSRGVYTGQVLCRVVGSGSSPLARGLLEEDGVLGPDTGIIPARAGFTREAPAAPDQRRDHPRSRGVYWPRSPAWPHGGGSSPLARGLHAADPTTADDAGIIPARAGFTAQILGLLHQPGDHPRSRGVYEPARAAGTRAAGSSPLARGLRLPPQRPGHHLGIIPARAGFTGPHRHHPRPVEDHPRSRGVYHTAMGLSLSARGSSPLARGLRRECTGHSLHARIIPARAGFTAG